MLLVVKVQVDVGRMQHEVAMQAVREALVGVFTPLGLAFDLRFYATWGDCEVIEKAKPASQAWPGKEQAPGTEG